MKNYACRKISSEPIDLFTPPPSAPKNAESNFVFTNKGFQIYGKWSKAKILSFLRDRLSRCENNAIKTAPNYDDAPTRLQSIIYSGLYSCRVLKELQRKGTNIMRKLHRMLPHNVIRAMKLGLVSLASNELAYFQEFKIQSCALYLENAWEEQYADELITNLRVCGLNESECWNVIKYGVVIQQPRILYRLLLGGVDVPGILDWQSPITPATVTVINFLKDIGIEEHVVELVGQYGIDEETREMLIHLGCNGTEEVVCKCSLELKPCVTSLVSEEIAYSPGVSTVDTEYRFDQFSCKCGARKEEETMVELTAQRNDYLRQNVMVPLAWAMARALNYSPSDPQYYIAYQLVRWKCGTVPRDEMEVAEEYVASATRKMDHQLVMKRLEEQEEDIRARNEAIIKSIPCDSCKNYPDSQVIKKLCSRCYKKSKIYAPCEFPLSCSTCKIEGSDEEEMVSRVRESKMQL